MRSLIPLNHWISQWSSNQTHRSLVKNGVVLGLNQVINYAFPLITLPYLTRVLTPHYFGLVMMAQAMMIYFSILTDYGFNLSGTKKIAKHQDDHRAVSDFFSTIMAIKIALMVVGFIILIMMTVWVPFFHWHRWLLLTTYLIVVGNVFFPTFLFQGLEKMMYVTVLNTITKVFFLVVLVLFIHDSDDYEWVNVIWGGGYLMANVVAFYIVKYTLAIQFFRPKWGNIVYWLRSSFEYFLSRAAIAIYINTNIIFIGMWLSPAQAGIYSGAEKLFFVVTTLYTPLIETIYPYISRTQHKSFGYTTLLVASGCNVIGCILVFFIADWVVPLVLGPTFTPSLTLFRWMLVVAVLHLPSSIIGYPLLGALGYVKVANRSVIIGGGVHILLIIACYGRMTAPIHFVWVMIVSQGVILGIRLGYLFKLIRDDGRK